MTKNNKKMNLSDSMIDISYQILFENQKPMTIQQLTQKVFNIKKLDINDKEICSQLYLDIVSSGLFVFCGDDLWNVKTNNLHLWDQEYFLNSNEEEVLPTEIEKEILDFNDFDLTKNENKDNEEIEEEIEEPIDSLEEIDDDHDEKIEEEFDDVDKNKDNDNEEDEYTNEYEDYFYKE